jgi:hypothetical protein
MTPRPDGRIHVCPFCGAEAQVAVGADQIGAGLKLDLANVEQFLSQLAHALHGNMGNRSKLELDGTRVVRFELNLGNDLFVALRESDGVVTQHKKLVRGIALKTAIHPVDRWVDLLAKALAAHANENARVAQVLNQLKGA